MPPLPPTPCNSSLRVRKRITYRNGKEIKTQQFQKFDNPRPAVLLSVEANADLYEAWGHRCSMFIPRRAISKSCRHNSMDLRRGMLSPR